MLWAYKNLDKPDAKPPAEGARLWAEYARKCPRRFLDHVLRADLLGARMAKEDSGGKATAEPELAATTCSPAAVVGVRTLRIRRLFIPHTHLAAYLTGGRVPWVRNLPDDFEVIDCGVDHERNGVVLTIHSWTFNAVAAGAPIPELEVELDRPPLGR